MKMKLTEVEVTEIARRMVEACESEYLKDDVQSSFKGDDSWR